MTETIGGEYSTEVATGTLAKFLWYKPGVAALTRRAFLGSVAALPGGTRRTGEFFRAPQTVPAQSGPSTQDSDAPQYKIVTPYRSASADSMGMPGIYPGRVVDVHSAAAIDPQSDRVDRALLRTMVERGMMELTGAKTPAAAWQKFFSKEDVVGVKVNASGAPGCVSSPELVNEVIAGLVSAGVAPTNLYLYERPSQQVDLVGYQMWAPDGVHVLGIERRQGEPAHYDPEVYVEASFFGEENTRSHLVRLVSQKLTKIVNLPNLKEHNAAGVTGCLKNISYGSFSNVARSHRNHKTHTRTFIGRLCTVEPLRSRTVLHILDGLRGVWHGGPFAPTRRFLWYPARLYFGTDPVAIDRLLLEVVEAKRLREGGASLWDRDQKQLGDDRSGWQLNPKRNRFIREPGHVEYAGELGLGVYAREKIKLEKVEL